MKYFDTVLRTVRRRRLVTALVLLALLTGVYVGLSPNGLVAGDGSELSYGMKYFAPVHPPGYPLYLIAGHAFVELFGLDFVTGPHYFSAVCAAAGLTLLFVFLRFRSVSTHVALLSTLLLAVSPPVWTIAVQAEVYALALLFFSLSLILWHGVIRRAQGEYLLWFVAGLSLTHHPVGLLNVGLAAHATWSGTNGVSFPRATALFVCPGLLYPILLIPGQGYPFNWPAFTEVPGLVAHVLGGSFTRFFLHQGAWTLVRQLTRAFLGHFSVVPFVLLAPLVIGYLWSRGHERFLIGVQVVFIGFLVFYGVPDITDFFVPSYLLTAVFLARGLEALKVKCPRGAYASLLVLCVGSAVAFGWVSEMEYNRRRTPYGNYARSLDRTLNRGTLVTDWSHYAPLRYVQLDRNRLDGVRLLALPPGYDLSTLAKRHRRHGIPLFSTVKGYWKQSVNYDLTRVGQREGLYRVRP